MPRGNNPVLPKTSLKLNTGYNMKIILLLLLIIVFVLSDTSHATTFTVGKNREYSSIQSAVNAATCGDTILIDAGTYVENVSRDNFPFCTGNPIKIIPSETGVIVDANQKCSAFEFKGTGYHNGRGGLIVGAGNGPNIEVRNIGYPGLIDDIGTECAAVKTEYLDDVTVQHLNVTSAIGGGEGTYFPESMSYSGNTAAVSFDYGDDWSMKNNICAAPSGMGHCYVAVCDTAWKYPDDRGVYVGHNIAKDMISSGIYISKCENNVVEHNYVEHNSNYVCSQINKCIIAGIAMRNSNNYKIRYNVTRLYGSGYWMGLQVRGNDPDYGATTSHYQYHNNIWDLTEVRSANPIFSFIFFADEVDAEFTNNIFCGPVNTSYEMSFLTCADNETKTAKFYNNIFCGNDDPKDWTRTNYCTDTNPNPWKVITDSAKPNKLNTTPLYQTSGSRPSPYYRPLNESAPQVDEGLNVLDYRGTDFDGNLVPSGISFDIGAFEYNTGSVVDNVPPQPPTLLSLD